MEITVRQYLEALDPHALVKLKWREYAMDEHTYNLWIQSPFANCVCLSAELTLKNLTNYYEWIGDLPIRALSEYDNYYASKKMNIKETTIIF